MTDDHPTPFRFLEYPTTGRVWIEYTRKGGRVRYRRERWREGGTVPGRPAVKRVRWRTDLPSLSEADYAAWKQARALARAALARGGPHHLRPVPV